MVLFGEPPGSREANEKETSIEIVKDICLFSFVILRNGKLVAFKFLSIANN